MQSLTVPTDRNPNDHTPMEVLAALQGRTGARRFTFRYDLLSADGTLVGTLSNVQSGKVAQNWLSDIKRTATFRLRETGGIDYLADRIRPWVRLHLYPYGTLDWVEWPQGVFLLATPGRTINGEGTITREVEAYDHAKVYADDLVTDRYAVPAGTQYIAAILTLLGTLGAGYPPASYPALPTSLPETKEWEPGTSKLKIMNELLDAINFESLSFNEMGGAVIRPYTSPADRAPEYTYATDSVSIMHPEVTQELDLWSVPNKWHLVVSDPDRPVLTSTYTNTNPASPTSTVRRGRTITDYRPDQEAADQATLDAKVARLAFEASQVFEAVEFSTGLMPIHSGNDVYRIEHTGLAVNAKYGEQSWELELRAGTPMKHRARRVVTV